MAVCLLLYFAIEAGTDSGLTTFDSQTAQTNSGAESESDNSPSSPDPDNDDVVLVVFATVILNSLAIALASLRVFVFTRHQSPLLQPPQTF